MATAGPNGQSANGAPKPGIQFGFDSPAMAHSTPQAANSAPIAIPGNNNRVPSPAHSPAPIPQPSASGGRPPSGLQGGQMTFGSLGSDGERHMRQGSVPPNANAMNPHAGTHLRRGSTHSVHSDNPGAAAGRGNFAPQNGRGRGGFNAHNNYNGNQMGYPPNGQFRHAPGQVRGMPPNFQNQPRNMPYPNSPQPNHRSPALVPSMPNTPNMPSANMQPNMNMQTPPQYHYPPPMAPGHQQNYGYPPQQLDQYGRPVQMSYGYNNMGYMGPPQGSSPGYNQQFVPPAYGHQPSHSMSRTPSQPERPSSANPHNHSNASTPQQQHAQPKVASSSFVRPKKSAAIQIKNQAGETVDFSGLKQPASPAASSQAKTPPVTTSAHTPPPKAITPSHNRTESQAASSKTAQEIQNELKAKIRQATQGATAEKAEGAVEAKDAASVAPKAPNDAVAAADTKADSATKAAEQPADKPVEKPAEPAAAAESEEDEVERMIREMEEADAKREKEEEEHRKKKDAEKSAAKAQGEEDRKKNAAEEDRKLREAEREMERLEEEKERKRAEADAGSSARSVADALAQARTGETATEPKVDSVADKLADMKIAGDKPGDKSAASEKRGKPAALNLAPLNTKPVEPPQPSAALQSLKSARFLTVMQQDLYPEGISSPNPALNDAVAKNGKTFKYDANFLLQFQKVFTEQPSLEFHQQVKSLLGEDGGRSASARGQNPGSARQASRSGAGTFPTMGAFNAPPGRTLPSGTSSEQRFAMASGAMPRPAVNPMASFQRPGGSFPGGSMSRTSSQTNMGNLQNSPRQSSRSTRGSRRGGFDAKEAQAAKTMPLTAGMDIKPIAVSASGWKPASIGAKGGSATNASGTLDPDMVQRKVKAALNKMTPEKFDRIADQILIIASQSKDESDGRTLRQVIQLTFEKATDEAHWASMYAKFCKRMLETMSPEIRDERIKDKNGVVVSGGALFRKYLLNRCQEEFERGWTTNLPEPTEEEGAAAAKSQPGEAAMLSDEYYTAAAAKRRGLGLVQFIGELYKLGMLTERIMHECVRKLVDHKGIPDEAEIESLSKLLRTIGANLDATDKGRNMMDVYFDRIQSMAALPELQSRMQFMLMDVIDLRKANWVSKETNKGPKTLEEVRADAEAAQAAKAQEAARSNQRGGGRPPAGRGDARNFSAGYNQQTSNQVGMDDLRRLKGSASRLSSANVTLGPTSMFASRSNSGRRLGPGGSLGRPGEDSGASSRTGTPPTRDNTSHSNAFHLLANMETENPASPPSTSASPNIAKAVPAEGEKKEAE